MKSFFSLLVTASSIFLASTAHASGFNCEEAGGLRVILRNHTRAETGGTRTPAVLIIEDTDGVRILVRLDTEIRKHIRENTTQYVAVGNNALGADRVIFQVPFRDGVDVLEADQELDGQLILVRGTERSVFELNCTRYLK